MQFVFFLPSMYQKVGSQKIKFQGILIISSLTPVSVPFFHIVLQTTLLNLELKLLWLTSLPQHLAYGYNYKPVAGSGHRSIEEDPFLLHPGIMNVQLARISNEKEKINKQNKKQNILNIVLNVIIKQIC